MIKIKGTPIFPGHAIGKAVIIKENEVSKVGFGDILVAVKTKPDYIIAASKAAAIITDVGGVTSHGAIIARELGIPCVIATKKATRVFKNGDTLEVDASKGIIQKIK